MSRLELSMAWRYMRSRRGSRLLSLISVIAVGGVTVPLPGWTAKFTVTPATGLPLASFTITEGGGVTAVPTGADSPPAFRAIVAAAPGLSAMAPELAGVSPVPPPKLNV